MFRKRRSVIDGTNESPWPIPIWRPRTAPLLPLHKRVINLLKPKPSLGNVIPIIPLPIEVRPKRPRQVSLGRHPSNSNRRVGRGQIVTTEAERLGPDVGTDRREQGGYAQGSWDSTSPTLSITPKITITPSLDDPFDPHPMNTLPRDRASSTLGRSTRRSGYVSSSRRRPNRASSSSSFTHVDVPPLPPRNTPHFPSVPSSSPGDRLFHHRTQILHLLRILHCLDLTRQLLYAHNRSALTMLESVPFPADVLRVWETELDDWWAESSGVLNLARQRIKAKISLRESEWSEAVKRAGGDMRKERRELLAIWRDEPKAERSLPVDVTRKCSEVTTISSRHSIRHMRQISHDSSAALFAPAHRAERVPSWVTTFVPEPFGYDEVEEQLWTLEEQGRIPSGTFSRMYGAGQIRRAHLDGSRVVGDFGMTKGEYEEAERLGVRGIDLDEQGRLGREGWRERKKRQQRWTWVF